MRSRRKSIIESEEHCFRLLIKYATDCITKSKDLELADMVWRNAMRHYYNAKLSPASANAHQFPIRRIFR